jgi:hypothetical protein
MWKASWQGEMMQRSNPQLDEPPVETGQGWSGGFCHEKVLI